MVAENFKITDTIPRQLLINYEGKILRIKEASCNHYREFYLSWVAAMSAIDEKLDLASAWSIDATFRELMTDCLMRVGLSKEDIDSLPLSVVSRLLIESEEGKPGWLFVLHDTDPKFMGVMTWIQQSKESHPPAQSLILLTRLRSMSWKTLAYWIAGHFPAFSSTPVSRVFRGLRLTRQVWRRLKKKNG